MASLYGQSECVYHKTVPNPYYLIKCGHPEKEGVLEAKKCNQCKKMRRNKNESNIN